VADNEGGGDGRNYAEISSEIPNVSHRSNHRSKSDRYRYLWECSPKKKKKKKEEESEKEEEEEMKVLRKCSLASASGYHGATTDAARSELR
jgi:hypothetical protein